MTSTLHRAAPAPTEGGPPPILRRGTGRVSPSSLVWLLVIRTALPCTVLTLGLGVLVLNGAVALVVSSLEPGMKVDGLADGVVVALGLTVLNTAVTSLLAIDDDDFWYRNVVRRQGRRLRATGDIDVPGVYFLEIDGLGHDVLRRVIRDGYAPRIKGAEALHAHFRRWLADLGHDSYRKPAS